MRITTIDASTTDSSQSGSQTPFPNAIACCPVSLERCMYRLLELLQAYWDEFRQPSASNLPSACQRFISATRASLRCAANVAQCRCDGWPDDQSNDRLAAQQANRFIEVLDGAIAARKEAEGRGVQSAIDALKLASSLVKEIPWGQLSERTRARDCELLECFVDKISSSRKGWSDTYRNHPGCAGHSAPRSDSRRCAPKEAGDMAGIHKKNSQRAMCERLIERGDVLELFEYIRAQSVPLPSDLSLGGLGRCIRLKARKDLNGLSDDIFGAILGLGMSMLMRCQAYIENQLEESDRFPGQTLPLIPRNLITEQWLERAERISRFCAEMAALRARVHHLNGIDDDRGNPTTSQERPRLVSAVDDGAGEAGSSQGAPRTRRSRAGAT